MKRNCVVSSRVPVEHHSDRAKLKDVLIIFIGAHSTFTLAALHLSRPNFSLFPQSLALQVAVFRNFRAHRPQDAEAPPVDLILWRKANSIKQPQDDVLFYEGNPPTKQYLQHRRCLISCLFCKDQVELMRLSEVSNRFLGEASGELGRTTVPFDLLYFCATFFWGNGNLHQNWIGENSWRRRGQLSQLNKQWDYVSIVWDYPV